MRLLASQSAQSGRSVVICDTTGHSDKEIEYNPKPDMSNLVIGSAGKNISIITGLDGASFLTAQNLKSQIKELADRFDQVYITVNKRNSNLGFMALTEFKPSLVLICALRKTKKSDIKNIKTKQSIDLLFYE